MSDSIIPVICAIECLKDLGFDNLTIQGRITQWIAKSGESGDWRDLKPEQQTRLGSAMQNYFKEAYGQAITDKSNAPGV